MKKIFWFAIGLIIGVVLTGGAWLYSFNDEQVHYDVEKTNCVNDVHGMHMNELMRCLGMVETEMDFRSLMPQRVAVGMVVTPDELKNTPCQEDLTALPDSELQRCDFMVRVERSFLYSTA